MACQQSRLLFTSPFYTTIHTHMLLQLSLFMLLCKVQVSFPYTCSVYLLAVPDCCKQSFQLRFLSIACLGSADKGQTAFSMDGSQPSIAPCPYCIDGSYFSSFFIAYAVLKLNNRYFI